ncbi:MAG: glucose dehydrogenase, partial [Planctomycetes bacterium]|nr:glucose dehydrogenase [Planctomycetota bacterium]
MRAPVPVLLALGVLLRPAAAQEAPPAYAPFIEPASDEAAAHQALIRLADGLSASLWAAEPLLANPVAFALDARGEVYVAESFRVHKGVTDVREHMDWLDDDLSCETVADRVAMYRKWLGADFDSYAREHDRVRLLRDSDGDGAADTATVLADGFARHETGIGAGLLVRRSPDGAREVFYTNIPDLWRLLDADGDGVAEAREPLSSGWGVRVAFMGHDMHGLVMGPDGRLYWSIGDRGFSVTTREGGRLHHPDTGAVLRCEPDGSRLEVYHLGLRNPQELAFDDRGDLFTGDNNCDAGDLARLVPIVQGGDSAWRQPVQWIGDRGPWGREKLWAPAFEGQAAWIIPPIANIASGPSGLTCEPGTALPSVAGQLLLCDFTGGADSSHVWAFPVEPQGAWFRLGAVTDLVSGILNTDCDIGPDGALYVADWVEGWSGVGKGRLWRITDPAAQERPVVAETRALLAGDWTAREVGALGDLLAHADRRVRQQAQFELAVRGRA